MAVKVNLGSLFKLINNVHGTVILFLNLLLIIFMVNWF